MERKKKVINGIEIDVIQREEALIGYWRSMVFSFEGHRILELSQSTHIQTDPISFMWREAEIILGSGHFRTKGQLAALEAVIPYAADLVGKWNKERFGKAIFPVAETE